jgi:glycosyltransferase involved in cell wall biosynthesis
MGKRIDGIMRSAGAVIAGNGYLAQRAHEAGAREICVLPTVLDPGRYSPARQLRRGNGVRIAWIGQPSGAAYLSLASSALSRAANFGPVCLRVIGAQAPEVSAVSTESLEWTLDSEASSLQECDIGIMPLPDSPWERGKCGYKLIQYMACGLPTLASPVGVNRDIVQHGKTGFLCASPDDWAHYLQLLMANPELCQRMGAEGRKCVEERFSVYSVVPKLAELLKRIAKSAIPEK